MRKPHFTKLRKRLRRILGTNGKQLSCEEAFGFLDEYVELEINDQLPTKDDRVKKMRNHIDNCPGCHEDYQSLREFIVRGQKEPTPTPK